MIQQEIYKFLDYLKQDSDDLNKKAEEAIQKAIDSANKLNSDKEYLKHLETAKRYKMLSNIQNSNFYHLKKTHRELYD